MILSTLKDAKEGLMGDPAKEARNAYYRAWRAKNKDRVKEINARYWKKKAAQQAEDQREDSNATEQAAQ